MRRNAGTLKKSGWHRGKYPLLWAERYSCRAASGWDELLRGLHLTEAQAAEVCARRFPEREAREITAWVRRNRTRRYVPEEILTLLGLELREVEAGFFTRRADRREVELA